MLLRSITLTATAAVWIGVTAATAPQPELPVVEYTAPQPAQSYDLTHEDTGDYTCWVEKATSQEAAEPVCGPRGLRPAGAVSLGAQVLVNGHHWVATMTGLEPVGAN